ncbi:hypothetical protein EJ02DRAFT_488412 [Clathrospora elynae]|uniref:Uncharacterized protein n=1 Tax=Clathrospora elynae TaxID=706981 RepID=A0A6A5S8T9_9PLEO|nr:hypothetical protein EJ02DRAFT_488412 [Clathrospora elynae]
MWRFETANRNMRSWSLSLRCRNRILFVTNEGHIGLSYHPDAVDGIRESDILTGLFGINVPFILRQIQLGNDDHSDDIPDEAPDERTQPISQSRYQMINIALVANHKYGHNFVESAAPGTKWQYFKASGMRECLRGLDGDLESSGDFLESQGHELALFQGEIRTAAGDRQEYAFVERCKPVGYSAHCMLPDAVMDVSPRVIPVEATCRLQRRSKAISKLLARLGAVGYGACPMSPGSAAPGVLPPSSISLTLVLVRLSPSESCPQDMSIPRHGAPWYLMPYGCSESCPQDMSIPEVRPSPRQPQLLAYLLLPTNTRPLTTRTPSAIVTTDRSAQRALLWVVFEILGSGRAWSDQIIGTIKPSPTIYICGVFRVTDATLAEKTIIQDGQKTKGIHQASASGTPAVQNNPAVGLPASPSPTLFVPKHEPILLHTQSALTAQANNVTSMTSEDEDDIFGFEAQFDKDNAALMGASKALFEELQAEDEAEPDPKLKVRWRACFGDMEKNPVPEAYNSDAHRLLSGLHLITLWAWVTWLLDELAPQKVVVASLCAVVYKAKQRKADQKIKRLRQSDYRTWLEFLELVKVVDANANKLVHVDFNLMLREETAAEQPQVASLASSGRACLVTATAIQEYCAVAQSVHKDVARKGSVFIQRSPPPLLTPLHYLGASQEATHSPTEGDTITPQGGSSITHKALRLRYICIQYNYLYIAPYAMYFIL